MRDVVLNNFWWKITALSLAVLAWFGFQPRELRPYLWPESRTEHTRVMIAHPVTIAKPATDTREFKVTPADVEITIRGSEKTLKELNSSEVRATVEISRALRYTARAMASSKQIHGS